MDTKDSSKMKYHEKGVIGGKTHDNGSNEEDSWSKNDGGTATDPVRGIAGSKRAHERIKIDYAR